MYLYTFTFHLPRRVAVLHGPKADSWWAHVAGERPGHAHHEAPHLQEVELADAGGSVDQEDNVCCLSIITPAWVGLGLVTQRFRTHTWLYSAGRIAIIFLPWAWFTDDSRTATGRNQPHIFTTWQQTDRFRHTKKPIALNCENERGKVFPTLYN